MRDAAGWVALRPSLRTAIASELRRCWVSRGIQIWAGALAAAKTNVCSRLRFEQRAGVAIIASPCTEHQKATKTRPVSISPNGLPWLSWREAVASLILGTIGSIPDLLL